MTRAIGDPFWWDENDVGVRARCMCGWAGDWREFIGAVRADEAGHACERAAKWREQAA